MCDSQSAASSLLPRAVTANLSARRLRTAGFTILELALTLAILAVLSVGILVPFVAQVSQRNIANTERILEQAKETRLGFAVVNGRLPCPATESSKGKESFSDAATGLCTSFYGYLPATTLGFTPIDSEGYALDGWGTRLNRMLCGLELQHEHVHPCKRHEKRGPCGTGR